MHNAVRDPWENGAAVGHFPKYICVQVRMKVPVWGNKRVHAAGPVVVKKKTADFVRNQRFFILFRGIRKPPGRKLKSRKSYGRVVVSKKCST